MDVPVLQRSRSAPALVLLSRPKEVVKGVPVFQSAGGGGGGNVSNERMKLERLRERTRLFSHLPSSTMKRRHERLRAASNRRGGRPFHHVATYEVMEEETKAEELDHQRSMWYSGAEAHAKAALRHDSAPAAAEGGGGGGGEGGVRSL